jgi:hypothetical protein
MWLLKTRLGRRILKLKYFTDIQFKIPFIVHNILFNDAVSNLMIVNNIV